MLKTLRTSILSAGTLGKKLSDYNNAVKGWHESKKQIIYLNNEEVNKIEATIMHDKDLANIKDLLLTGCELGRGVSDLSKMDDSCLVNAQEGQFVVIKEQQNT